MKRWLLAIVAAVALWSIPVDTANAQWGVRVYGGYSPYRTYYGGYYQTYRPYYYYSNPYRSYYGYGYPYRSYYYTPGWSYYYYW
jgi:hypothetical protein